MRVSVHVTSVANFHQAFAAGADEFADLPPLSSTPLSTGRKDKRGLIVLELTPGKHFCIESYPKPEDRPSMAERYSQTDVAGGRLALWV
jgi:hypothetical protein